MDFSFRIRKSFGDSFDCETADYIESIATTKNEDDDLVRLFGWDFFADGGLTAPFSIGTDLRKAAMTLRPGYATSLADGSALPFASVPDIECEFGDIVFFDFTHGWSAGQWSDLDDHHDQVGLVYDRCELDTLDGLIAVAEERLGYPARSLLLRFEDDTILGLVFGRFEMRILEHDEPARLEYFAKDKALEVAARLRGEA